MAAFLRTAAGCTAGPATDMVTPTPLCRIENINQAVHAAFEQEKADFELELTDAMSQTVADAVETAIFDRAFDFRANVSGCLAGRLAGCRGQGGREALLPQLC